MKEVEEKSINSLSYLRTFVPEWLFKEASNSQIDFEIIKPDQLLRWIGWLNSQHERKHPDSRPTRRETVVSQEEL